MTEAWDEWGWNEGNVFFDGVFEDYIDEVIGIFLDEFDFSPYE